MPAAAAVVAAPMRKQEGMTVASTIHGTTAVMAESVGMAASITPIATATETQGV